jgi:competence protein ComEA
MARRSERSGLRFGREAVRPAVRGRVLAMVALLLVAVGMLLARRAVLPEPAPVADVVVEVRGDVAAPGFHALPPPVTLSAALAAAGAPALDAPEATLRGGTRVVVEAGAVRLETMDELLVVGLPIDVNRAAAPALRAVPGLGPARSAAIVAERQAGGPYADVDALSRVRGIGPATVERLRPFLTAEPVPEGP